MGMEERVGELMGAWMGMQKLATTPFPFPYAQMCTFFLYLWCYCFPVAAAANFQWYGCVVTFVMCFALFGINAISLELEDPFGTETNDLDLDFFEKASMAACKAMVGEPLKPEEVEPVPGKIVTEAPSAPMPSPMANGAPASPTAKLDTTTILADPSFCQKAHSELLSATNMASMSAELQTVFKEFFARYDLDGTQTINNNKELTQLVTNLAFA